MIGKASIFTDKSILIANFCILITNKTFFEHSKIFFDRVIAFLQNKTILYRNLHIISKLTVQMFYF